MKFAKQKLAMLCTVLLLAGCVTAPAIEIPVSACSSLLPKAWNKPVVAAPLPESADGDPASTDWLIEMLQRWTAFGVEQTGQLDKANDRYATAMAIIEQCQERDRVAVRKSRRWF
jgi:hypothetical protein